MTNDKGPTPSMSDIIVAFASPLLNPDMEVRQYEAMLKFAATIWNIVFLPEEKYAAARKQILDRFAQGNPRDALAWANTIDSLIRSRKEVFGFDNRFLTGVAVVQRKGRWDVQTDYTIPGEEPEPAP